MRYRPGQIVVYEKEKHTSSPGHRARQVRPDPHGEYYTYVVTKYWVVDAVEGDRLHLRTPGGKLYSVSEHEERLRHLAWRERLWLALFDRKRLRALRAQAAAHGADGKDTKRDGAPLAG